MRTTFKRRAPAVSRQDIDCDPNLTWRKLSLSLVPRISSFDNLLNVVDLQIVSEHPMHGRKQLHPKR